jgi:hypothetical protein
VTDDRFGGAHPLPEALPQLRAGLASRPPVPIVTGFIGRTAAGEMTTLGRGGSDYTAAIVGAALGAEEIQIWTDTSGMMSADPRIVPEAQPVPRLSFKEAAELAYFGAKCCIRRRFTGGREGDPGACLEHPAPRRSRLADHVGTDTSEAYVAHQIDLLQEGNHLDHRRLDAHADGVGLSGAGVRDLRPPSRRGGSGHHFRSVDLAHRR